MKRVCIIGCGSIGSLYAAHLAGVTEVWAFVRRAEHARALNQDGLRVSGTHELHARLRATNDPSPPVVTSAVKATVPLSLIADGSKSNVNAPPPGAASPREATRVKL